MVYDTDPINTILGVFLFFSIWEFKIKPLNLSFIATLDQRIRPTLCFFYHIIDNVMFFFFFGEYWQRYVDTWFQLTYLLYARHQIIT